jgi:hypothetical protein
VAGWTERRSPPKAGWTASTYSTSDPDLSADDVALGYKNLLEAERGSATSSRPSSCDRLVVDAKTGRPSAPDVRYPE